MKITDSFYKRKSIWVCVAPDGNFLVFGVKGAWVSKAAAKLAMTQHLLPYDAKAEKGKTKFETYLKPLGYYVLEVF